MIRHSAVDERLTMTKEHSTPSKRRKQQYAYVERNRALLNKKSLARRNKWVSQWVGLIPVTASCQVCGQPISFGDKVNPIVFDHRHGGNEAIQGCPSTWLIKNRRTAENERVWKSCDFGTLCRRCNHFLPTKDRIAFLEMALKYCQKGL